MTESASVADQHPTRVGVMAVTALVLGATLVGSVVGYAIRGPALPSSPPPSAPVAAPLGTTLPASPIDIGFLQDMYDHHGQAVLMADFEAAHGTEPAVRTLAAQMIADQRREIGLFEAYLYDRGGAPGGPNREVMGWMGTPTPHEAMAGLASKDDVAALLNANGPDLDRLFLRLMIRHHEGGVHMAEYAAIHVVDPAIKQLAQGMVVKQRREITDMEQLSGE